MVEFQHDTEAAASENIPLSDNLLTNIDEKTSFYYICKTNRE